MMNIQLREAFKETQRMVRENGELRELTLRVQAGTELFLGGYEAVNPSVRREEPKVFAAEDTTFHCASRYASRGKRTAVLNFANAYSPGGGVKNGAAAQEECLCRSSNLYEALTLPYLLKNYYKWNSRNTGDMGTDAVIWSPGVTVFRTDDLIPEDLFPWFQTDVLTCAAPYYDAGRKTPVPMEKLEEVFFARIRNILEVAASKGPDVLVLGAFGCGAFHNPPELVADVFRRLLVQRGYGRYFEKVVFAVKGSEGPNRNLEAFREAFADGEKPSAAGFGCLRNGSVE